MEVLLKGVGVGLAIAAPVGPIGLLCIRRTLTDGRIAGLATGFGAATADGLYGLLVAAGFVVSGVLDAYAAPMALGGGVLIALLGLMALRGFWAGPAQNAAEPGATRHYKGWVTAYATTFVLTLSNPTTILAFVGLISALGSAASANPAAPYWLVLGVFTGSALWWLILVQVTLMARSRMAANVTRWLDLASGLVLLFWGGWVALTAF